MPRITHNKSNTPEYEAWAHIVQRCTNPRCKAWKHYGARGISICDEWRRSFESFLAHIGLRPSPKHSIDRINNDGNYEPGNVRWATLYQQRRNHRANRLVSFRGKTQCLMDWATELGVPHQVLQWRLERNYPLDRRNAAAERTHCPQGHPYNETNTWVRKLTGHRSCRICTRAHKLKNNLRYNENRRIARVARRGK